MSCLIVEDEIYFAQVLHRAMQNHYSQNDIACDGERALAMAKTTCYDLILLDLTLPKIDGIAVLRRLRREGVASRILIVSGRDAVDQRIDGLNAGADDYICKPFHLEELHARVAALQRRPQPLLTVADLVLDNVRLSVTRGGQKIQLCRKEFSILEYLIRNAGIPVTRALLMEHCWDGESVAAPSVIDVYINCLRRKIDHGFENKLIHTLRGVGYTIMDTEAKKLSLVKRSTGTVDESVGT